MSENLLTVRRRTPSGKGGARQLRKIGQIPGVYYGHNEPPLHFALNAMDLSRLLRGHHRIINLQIEGEEVRPCLIRELQRDPVDDKPYHIDMLAVHTGEKLTTNVPVRFVGLALGVKDSGGILEHSLMELSVECLPADIPEFVEVDVSALDIGDSLHVSDISIPGVEFLDDANTLIVHVSLPSTHKEAAPAADETPEADKEA